MALPWGGVGGWGWFLLFPPRREDGFHSGKSLDDSSFSQEHVELSLISPLAWRV